MFIKIDGFVKVQTLKQDLISPGLPMFNGNRLCAEVLNDKTTMLYSPVHVKD